MNINYKWMSWFSYRTEHAILWPCCTHAVALLFFEILSITFLSLCESVSWYASRRIEKHWVSGRVLAAIAFYSSSARWLWFCKSLREYSHTESERWHTYICNWNMEWLVLNSIARLQSCTVFGWILENSIYPPWVNHHHHHQQHQQQQWRRRQRHRQLAPTQACEESQWEEHSFAFIAWQKYISLFSQSFDFLDVGVGDLGASLLCSILKKKKKKKGDILPF